jgi:hypothetical protein
MCVCVCAFSLHQESPDMILGDKPLISEVVLSHKNRHKISFCACAIDDGHHRELDRRRMQLKHWYHHPYTAPNLPQLNNIAGKGEYS